MGIVGDTTGAVHLIASVVALATGLYVLVARKGTTQHRQIGYLYVVAMLMVNITAFMIYRLIGKFNIFHVFAIISLITLSLGMYPLWKKNAPNYLLTHFRFMYWSVVGLYCAFMAELFSRLPRHVLTVEGKPMTIFYNFVGLGILFVMIIAVAFFIKLKPMWTKKYKRA